MSKLLKVVLISLSHRPLQFSERHVPYSKSKIRGLYPRSIYSRLIYILTYIDEVNSVLHNANYFIRHWSWSITPLHDTSSPMLWLKTRRVSVHYLSLQLNDIYTKITLSYPRLYIHVQHTSTHKSYVNAYAELALSRASVNSLVFFWMMSS